MSSRTFTVVIACFAAITFTFIGIYLSKVVLAQGKVISQEATQSLEIYRGTTSTEVDTYDVEYIVENALGWNAITVTLHTKGNSGKAEEVAIIATDEFSDHHWDSITFTRKHRAFGDAPPLKVVRSENTWRTESGDVVDLILLGKI
jgi:hypothetical protein